MRARSIVLLAVVLGVAPVAAAGPECLLAWRVGGSTTGDGGVVAECRDGDPICDADGAVNGACAFSARLCFSVSTSGACAPASIASARVRGRGAAPLAAATTALGTLSVSETCTAPVTVEVALGRRARRQLVLRAAARAADGSGTDRDRLALVCTSAAGPRGAGRAIVVTTDFETGRLATVGIAPPHPRRVLDVPIHADAVVRVAGDRVYVVNRFLGDNLQVLDPARGFRTLLQCSTGPGSNPHDVAVLEPHKAYVTRYDRGELWIVDPGAAGCGGFVRGAIDLRAWADGDGLPEMDQMALVGSRLFVTLDRLDRARRFAPSGRSRIVVVDTTSDAAVATIELTGANAFGDATGLVREPGTGKLLVAEAGDLFRTGDGGIERVDPDTLAPEGFVVTEDDLGGSITDFVVVSERQAYAILLDARLRNVLVAFDPAARRVTRRLLVRTDYLPDIALAPDGRLWLADGGLPSPGIRIFDPAGDRQLTRAALDVGLPPFAIAFVP